MSAHPVRIVTNGIQPLPITVVAGVIPDRYLTTAVDTDRREGKIQSHGTRICRHRVARDICTRTSTSEDDRHALS